MTEQITQEITDLPTPPSRQDPTTFDARADAFMNSLDDLASEINTWAPQANAVANAVNIDRSIVSTDKGAVSANTAIVAINTAAVADNAAAVADDKAYVESVAGSIPGLIAGSGVKVSDTDTVVSDLESKLTIASNSDITLTKKNIGGNEYLEIDTATLTTAIAELNQLFSNNRGRVVFNLFFGA